MKARDSHLISPLRRDIIISPLQPAFSIQLDLENAFSINAIIQCFFVILAMVMLFQHVEKGLKHSVRVQILLLLSLLIHSGRPRYTLPAVKVALQDENGAHLVDQLALPAAFDALLPKHRFGDD